LSGAGDYVAARSRLADLATWLHGKPRDTTLADSDNALAPAEAISHPLTPFHWEIEFPEVFGRENPGFAAIVGNPPFAGKNTLAASTGESYPEWLKAFHDGSHGNADLVAHFFRRAFAALRNGGTFGLIATNTIAQGDTRSTGLRPIRKSGGTIYNAARRLKWPGDAAVVVSVVHIGKASSWKTFEIDGRRVPLITAFLLENGGDDDPSTLADNAGRSFVGSYVLGMGFTFEDVPEADTSSPGVPIPLAHMKSLLAASPHNSERIFPYLGGEEVNTSPKQEPHRFVINFGDMDEADCRATWPDLMRLVELKVKPERLAQARETRKRYWWRFGESTPALYRALQGLNRVLVISQTSRILAFAFQSARICFSHKTIVFPFTSCPPFCILQSRVHEAWARTFGSTMKDDAVYTPSDCFETFPFPENFETDARLEAVGKEYYEFRAALMVKNDEGLTKTYNRFHDPGEASAEIARLRELHAAMDRAVLDAYGWQDVQPVCGFALDWLDLDDDELAETLASAPDDIRERIESADYFFPDAASACRFQSHIKKDGKGKLPWRYRWPDDTRDDILARLLALNAQRAELERLTGLPGASPATPNRDPASATPEDSDSTAAPPAKAKRAKKDSKRATKKSALRPMFDEADE
jgi:hypothetical protein